MSCPNFYLNNASHYYVVLDTEIVEDENGKEVEVPREYMDVDDFIYPLEALNKGWRKDDERLRLIEGAPFAAKDDWISPYKGKKSEDLFCINIKTRVVWRSGYYNHANFDYELEVTTNYGGHDYTLCECGRPEDLALNMLNVYRDLVFDYGEDFGWNEGTFKLQSKWLLAWLESTFDRYCAEAELACLNCCDKVLTRTALFSNGEAWYEEVSNENINVIRTELERQAV